MRMATVRPAAGLSIVMPHRQNAFLPEAGDTVPLDDYWRARLRDGDVVAVQAPPPPAPAAEKPTKTKS